MGESETELCQHIQREMPCQGCQGLEREGTDCRVWVRREWVGLWSKSEKIKKVSEHQKDRSKVLDSTRRHVCDHLCHFFITSMFVWVRVDGLEPHWAFCLRSAAGSYRFRPVGVIIVQLTEQRKADCENGSCGTDSCGFFALQSRHVTSFLSE